MQRTAGGGKLALSEDERTDGAPFVVIASRIFSRGGNRCLSQAVMMMNVAVSPPEAS